MNCGGLSVENGTGGSAGLENTGQRPREFFTVQALRAVAAIMVVFFHCLCRWAEQNNPLHNLILTDIYCNGAAGVDLFFVISGFVIVVSSQKLLTLNQGWKTFIEKRLTRIVPLYWILMTIKLATVYLAPHVAFHHDYNLPDIVSSYAFIPTLPMDGSLRPVLTAGWTLSFEMFFYASFAICMALRKPPLLLLTPFFILLACLYPVRSYHWPSAAFFFSDIVPFEFLFGMVIARAVLKGERMGRGIAIAALIGSAAVILSMPSVPTTIDKRVLVWGLPSAFILFACVSNERAWGQHLPKWLLALGDASYSIYLIQAFVIPAIDVTLTWLHVPAAYKEILLLVVGLPACCIAGYLVYSFFEAPMTQFLKRRIAFSK